MGHKVDIGIGHVDGLLKTLQSSNSNTLAALLHFSTYIDSWPNSISIATTENATIYNMPADKQCQSY
jgi:hypothetical protein